MDEWTGEQTDGQTDNVKPVYPSFNFVEAGGIITWVVSVSELSSEFFSTFITEVLYGQIVPIHLFSQ